MGLCMGLCIRVALRAWGCLCMGHACHTACDRMYVGLQQQFVCNRSMKNVCVCGGSLCVCSRVAACVYACLWLWMCVNVCVLVRMIVL